MVAILVLLILDYYFSFDLLVMVHSHALLQGEKFSLGEMFIFQKDLFSRFTRGACRKFLVQGSVSWNWGTPINILSIAHERKVT